MSHASLLLLAVLLTLASIAVVFTRVGTPSAPSPAARRPQRAPAAATPSGTHDRQEKTALRDSYIAARFSGRFERGEDFRDIGNVIKAARLYYEDGRVELAQELLGIAISHSPAQLDLRLAQIELAYLARDEGLFTELAHSYRIDHPSPQDWDEICRLGRALAPGQAVFGESATALPSSSHQGRWPDTPDCIQASWDLKPDVLAADFHRAVYQRSMS